MDWTGLDSDSEREVTSLSDSDSDSERLDDLHYSFENQLINMIG